MSRTIEPAKLLLPGDSFKMYFDDWLVLTCWPTNWPRISSYHKITAKVLRSYANGNTIAYVCQRIDGKRPETNGVEFVLHSDLVNLELEEN